MEISPEQYAYHSNQRRDLVRHLDIFLHVLTGIDSEVTDIQSQSCES